MLPMSKLMHTGRSLLELLLVSAVGLIPIVSGLTVMFYQLERKLDENARISGHEALFAIDRRLDSLLLTASTASQFSGQACDNVIEQLRAMTASDPRIHSLVLTRDDLAYCSTLPTIIPHHIDITAGRTVRLNFDSPTTPNGVMVEYRLSNDGLGIIATSYGIELRRELQGFQDGLVLVLEFEDAYLWSQGDSRDQQQPSQSEFFRSAPSTRHDYRVNVGYPAGYTLAEARTLMVQVLPSLTLVGLLTAAITYWGILRARRKRERTTA